MVANWLKLAMAKKVACECRHRGTRANPAKVCDECQRRECFEWQWDKDEGDTTVVLNNDDRDAIFNPGFSVGTAAVRGTKPFKPGYHHYWEIEMSTEVYGTDMMIGVGTDKTDLRRYSHNFVSLLGLDDQSWGLSYSGKKKHAGQSHQYSKPFGQNSIVGVHLDLWAGTLEFYIDRKPLGLAFDGLRDKVLYPIISSTAARSGMNLIFCRSYPPSLQLHAMLALSQNLLSPVDEENASIFKVLSLPPGMRSWMKNHYWWIVSCRDRERKREEELNNRAKCDKQCRKQKRTARLQRAEADAEQQRADYEDDESESEGDDNDDDDDDDDSSEGLVMLAPQEAEPSNPAVDPQLPTTPRRRRHQRSQQQCTGAQPAGESGGSGGGTSCMRLLAATSSRAQFLGRVSPIFVGMPEGGFSLLSAGAASSSHNPAPASSSSSNYSRPVTRSRSAPAQPTAPVLPGGSGTATASKVIISRDPSSSEEDEERAGRIPHSTRREPKRLKLRTSIDANGDDNEDKDTTEEEDCGEKP